MATLISFSVQDEDGDRATVPLFVQDGLTLAQYTEYAQTMGGNIDLAMDGVIVGINLTLGIALLPGWKQAAVAESEVQKGALYNFSTAGRFSHSIRVPCCLQTRFQGDNVDLTPGNDQDLLAGYIANGITITGGTVVSVNNGDGIDLVALNKATKSQTK